MLETKCGDNVNFVHKMRTLEDVSDVLVVYCERCKARYYFRKDAGGRIMGQNYHNIFKRDTLQPHQNLYYKEYKGRMNIA